MLLRLLLALFLNTIVLSHSFAANNWQKFEYFQNTGGLNDTSSTTEINDNEATDLQNIIFDTGGAIIKRHGFQDINFPAPNYQLASGVTGVTGLSYFKTSTGGIYLFALGNNAGTSGFYEKAINADGSIPSGAWTNVTTSSVFSSFTDNSLGDFVTANDKLVITADSGTAQFPLAWTPGSNVTLLTSDANCPKAKYLAWHKNILFTAGDPNNPDRVSFSDLTNGITTWVATDFFDLDKNDGEQIRGLKSAFGNLYIFEDNSIWMLTGSTRDDFNLQRMVTNVGTLSQQSIKIIGNYIVFVTSQNDIAVYDGNYTVKFLSSKIRNTIGSTNFSRANRALGLGFSTYRYKDLDYYVAESLSAQTNNNLVLMYDTEKTAWTKFIGLNPDSWTTMPNKSGQDMIVWGDYNGHVFFYPDTTSYNDVSDSCSGGNPCTTTSPSIYSYYQSKWFRYSNVSLGDKHLKLIKTYVSNTAGISNTLTMEVKTDYATSGTIYNFNFTASGAKWDSAIWDSDNWPGGNLNISRQEINQNGIEMYQVKYSNGNSGEPMNIIGYQTFIESTDQI